MILISLLIIGAYALNALMDGIAEAKTPKGRELSVLWHAVKYLCVGLIFLAGVQFTLLMSLFDFVPLVLWCLSSALLGIFVRQITLRIYRQINWPDWA